jgi:hypothetical protein
MPLKESPMVTAPSSWLDNSIITIILVIISSIVLALLWRRSSLLTRRKKSAETPKEAPTRIPDDLFTESIASQAKAPTPVDTPMIWATPSGPERQPIIAPAESASQAPLVVEPAPEQIAQSAPQPATKPSLRAIAAPQGQEFVLSSGVRLRSLGDLLDILPTLNDDIFYHHVTSDRNDFRSWIQESLGLPTVANAIGVARTREEMTHVLVLATS